MAPEIGDRRSPRSRPTVLLVLLIFVVIALVTNILGPIIPDMIRDFALSLTMAGFLPFSFFVAYGVMSIPSGMLVERYREKRVIAAAFALAFLGSLGFALVPRFAVGLASLFLIGIGMAVLQVAINPLLRVAGGEEHFAFNSVLAQLVFGLASFVGPQAYASLVGRGLSWVALYWLFAAISGAMAALVLGVRLPGVERTEEERAGAWATYAELLRQRQVLLYALGIFCYVGVEQGVSNWISEFLRRYHGMDPQTTGANAVSWFWGLMTAGCLLGLLLLKLYDSRTVLIGASLAAVFTLAFALFGPATVSLVAFPLVGFCASVMWGIVFSLALNSVPKHHGSFSGILCTAIVGGAVAPLVVGGLGDHLGLRFGMLFLYVPLAYVLGVGFWARPLIANATIGRSERSA